ncbi:MAG: DUF4239 domain-containing protein [Candidatus Eisenbacteria bacterium]|nr:DUF4239 domain-containing protein [Candidatus Eisenbacteria bacterium]
MTFSQFSSLSVVILFLGMIACTEVGRRLGLARLARHPDGLAKGVGPVEAAVFSLLGLLLAFTFSGAASRFMERRQLIAAEARTIDMAYMRIDLLPVARQPELRELFRRYVDLRLLAYRNPSELTISKAMDDVRAKSGSTAALQREIWTKALEATQAPGANPEGVKLLLPALNETFGITTTESMARENHPPMVVFLLLFGLCLISSLLVGYSTSGNKDRIWLHAIVYAIILSLVVFVIVNIEFPRMGWIRVDPADHFLMDAQQHMQ